MIGFNIPIYIEGSLDCIEEAIKSRKICIIKNHSLEFKDCDF